MVNPCKVVDETIRKHLNWVNINFTKIVGPHLELLEEGPLRDINDTAATYYYRYLTAAMKALKPKQVVELGSAAGVGLLSMLPTLPKTSNLIACSIPEPEIEFRYIPEGKYDNLTLVRGDDLDPKVWPKDIDLNKTDIWFIDTDHNYAQLSSELRLYDKFFKQGAIVLLDDITLNDGMKRAWSEIEYPKLSLPDLHHSGYGMFYVDHKK